MSKDRSGTATRAKRHKRIMLWSLLVMVLGTMLLPLTGYLYVSIVPAQAAQGSHNQGVNPRANYWRAVREGDKGYTSASGPYTTDTLIQNGGENYRNFRNGPISSIGPWVMAVALLAIALFYLIKGTTRVEEPRSGRMLERWSGGERLIHWYTAILFIILEITGLSLLFGRAVLIPLLGIQGFAAWAEFAKVIHNWSGPLFMVGIILEIVAWARYNTFKSYDWDWLKKFGGMLKRGVHAHAGRTNAGEKIWFWFIATFGLIGVCITGLIFDFPNFGQSRETMQWAALIHSSLGVLWIAISFGHIYLGTLGVEEAWQGMTKGEVSEEWMRQHHDLWLEEIKKGGTGQTADKAAQDASKRSPGAASS